MSIIPCSINTELKARIDQYVEELKIEAHKIGTHGLSEEEFYNSGLFRGAIERIRGQFSASMGPKREFAKHVLNYMEDKKFICSWESSGGDNRHDYIAHLPSGRVCAIELKGCLDGNNTNIFERPPHANEFIIWSICTNPGADPRHNVWSGIHTRLSAEIVSRSQRVDGLVVWDMMCGTIGRPCPKLAGQSDRVTDVGPFRLPPPCVYMMPATIPSPRNNPTPRAQSIDDVQFLKALHQCFGGQDEEFFSVDFSIGYKNGEIVRTTIIKKSDSIIHASNPTPIRRS